MARKPRIASQIVLPSAIRLIQVGETLSRLMMAMVDIIQIPTIVMLIDAYFMFDVLVAITIRCNNFVAPKFFQR